MLDKSLKFFVAAFVCALWVLVFHFIAKGDLEKPTAPILEYKDFVTILLTCLAVMIAIATIFAAVAAVWGFEFLKRETQAHAESAAQALAEKIASERAEQIARERIEAILPGLVERAVKFEMQSLKSSSDQQGLDVRGDQIADEIAKEK